jgi:hypothetical protein
MTSATVIPRHGAAIVRMTLVPTLSLTEKIAWTAAREWPILGAVAALGVLIAVGPRANLASLDPVLVIGYVGGLLLTRAAAAGVRRAVVRLEVVTISQ